MALWRFMLTTLAAAALVLAYSSVYAQADENTQVAGPTLDCSVVALRIMTAEVGGARFACRIVGAPAADSTFSVQVTNAAAETQLAVPLCTGSLAGGAGVCSGSYINRDGGGLGQLTLAATLQPSGSGLGPLVLEGSPPPAPVEPLQIYPISE
jgi:hypothetical protein